MNEIYTPTEQAILCDYFKIRRPKACQSIDIYQPTKSDSIFAARGTYIDDEVALSNAVARIALSVIQNRLPQCGVFDGDGKLTLTRKHFARPPRDVVMLPQHLFMINWADTAPGISWPESYHVTYIPGFDRYVMTASFDGADMHGVTELAVGHFDGDRPPVEASAEALKAWWRHLQGNGQDRWAYVWDEGLISKDTADDWAEEVWGSTWPHIEDEVVVIQSEEGDVSESLRLIIMEIIDPGGQTSNSKKQLAYDGLRQCLDPATTPRKNLLEVVDYVRQLGHLGRPLTGTLVSLLKQERGNEKGDLLIEIVAALTDIKPTDENLHDYMVELLLDSSATAGSRSEAAEFLFAVTGIDAYKEILKCLRRLGNVELSFRAAPHDSSIYTRRDCPTPRPTSDQNKIADRCLAIVLAEGANSTCSEGGKDD